MGKKKSVVLMTFLTIVIVALCVITAFPSFRLPWSENKKDKWVPAILQMDVGRDFGDGYYTYYYPNGVITEADYRAEYLDYETTANEATEDKDEAEKAFEDFKTAYARVEGVNGLRFSTDDDAGILADYEVTKDSAGKVLDCVGVISEDFNVAFGRAVNEVKKRYAAKEYEYCNINVVNDYVLRLELGAGEKTETGLNGEIGNDPLTSATQAFTLFNMFGEFTFMQNGETVPVLANDDGTTVKDLVEEVKLKTKNDVTFLQIIFTAQGSKMVSDFTSSGATTLDVAIGGQKMMSVPSSYVSFEKINFPIAELGDTRYAETIAILLSSLRDTGVIYIGDADAYSPIAFSFAEINPNADIRSFSGDYGENVLYWVFGGVLLIMLALMVASVIKKGGFGIVNVYTNLSYFIITALCFAFISAGVLEFSAASIMIFLFGLVLVNVFHSITYNAIKKEFMQGKTVQSAVRNGYKKTLWNVIDVYAVLLLAALALLVGVANLHTLAIQALICVIAAAFCSLLWERGINYVLLSASNNKYKYFRFVREDDEDED
ncbi:MAG: hypothetical protein E7352_05255 [Clostridiales bacterium]|nr:hypothetical protein [Clostridiales bacterium]